MKVDSTVRDLLNQKGCNDIKTIGPHELVFEALKNMALHNVGALLVTEKGRVVGIITERDYARKVILRDRTSRNTRVHEIMERDVIYVRPSDTAEFCLALMSTKRVRHLPVFEEEQLIGLVSMGDVVKALINDREFLIDQLTHYITGSYVGWFDNIGEPKSAVEYRALGV